MHELDGGEGRMRVVEVDRHLLRQQLPVAVVGEEASKHVLHGRGDEEVLLTQAQLPSLGGGVVRIEHATHRLGVDLARERVEECATVERR